METQATQAIRKDAQTLHNETTLFCNASERSVSRINATMQAVLVQIANETDTRQLSLHAKNLVHIAEALLQKENKVTEYKERIEFYAKLIK